MGNSDHGTTYMYMTVVSDKALALAGGMEGTLSHSLSLNLSLTLTLTLSLTLSLSIRGHGREFAARGADKRGRRC